MEWAVKSSFILRLEVVHGTFPVWAPLLLLSHFSPTLCDPIDGSPPGSAVPGILQARTLEWVAIAFSPGLPIHHQLPEFTQTHVS